jgi:shikimate kinase
LRVLTTTSSAITILNGIRSQYASAVAIDINFMVSITPYSKLDILIEPPVDDILVKSCLKKFEEYTQIIIKNIKILIKSNLPPARGLKSSSAVSSAIIDCLSKYYNIGLSTKEIIEIGAIASINANVSISGAYDDAYASYCGGLAITMNYEKELVKLLNIPDVLKNLNVVLLVSKTHLTKSSIKPETNVDENLIKLAYDYLMKEKFLDVIKLNTEAYGSVLLPNYSIIEELFSIKNVKAVGLNGTGPSLYLLTEGSIEIQDIKSISSNYEIKHCKFRDIEIFP